MKTYEPTAGTSINAACREAVNLATQGNTEITFTFNGIALEAAPSATPEGLVARWHLLFDAEREAYRNSPEGKKAAAERDAEILRKQTELNATVEALPKILRTDNHLNALIKWIGELVEPSDDVDVAWNPARIVVRLESAGYIENKHVGRSPEWFNTRERMGWYIIGQAINCMNKGMGPHPVTLSFCKKYFSLQP